MNQTQLLSRRNVDEEEKVDARPDDPAGDSPFAQLRRLFRALSANVAEADDFIDMDEALDAFREFWYRKLFGATHEEFVTLNETNPRRIDWLLYVSEVDRENYNRNKSGSEKRTR